MSVRLASTNGVGFLAERSMWWPHGQPWIEAHNAAGATASGTKWAVGDGEVGVLPEDTASVAESAGRVNVTPPAVSVAVPAGPKRFTASNS